MVSYCSEIVHRVSLIPGSADSEVSEEQKKEKVAELQKKEKDLQDKLAKKLEELKKICLREAVSFQSFRCFLSDLDRLVIRTHLLVVFICRNSPDGCLKNIHLPQDRRLHMCAAVLGQPLSWMIFPPMMRLLQQ